MNIMISLRVSIILYLLNLTPNIGVDAMNKFLRSCFHINSRKIVANNDVDVIRSICFLKNYRGGDQVTTSVNPVEDPDGIVTLPKSTPADQNIDTSVNHIPYSISNDTSSPATNDSRASRNRILDPGTHIAFVPASSSSSSSSSQSASTNTIHEKLPIKNSSKFGFHNFRNEISKATKDLVSKYGDYRKHTFSSMNKNIGDAKTFFQLMNKSKKDSEVTIDDLKPASLQSSSLTSNNDRSVYVMMNLLLHQIKESIKSTTIPTFTPSSLWHKNQVLFITSFFISLLGTSTGFHSFLYFVTVGYTLSIFLITSSSLLFFNLISNKPIPILTNLHTGLCIAWSIRLTIFLLYREYFLWPELHSKLKEVNQSFSKTLSKNNSDGNIEATKESSNIAFHSKRLPIWLASSFFYTIMAMPCVVKLNRASSWATNTAKNLNGAMRNNPKFPRVMAELIRHDNVTVLGILLQIIGFLLESIADYQKSCYKVRYRQKILHRMHTEDIHPKESDGRNYHWCNVGLWKYSTFPNYLGEILFWIGTYVGALNSYGTTAEWLLCTVGLIFILAVMKNAIDSLSTKQYKNYGFDDEYLEYRRTHSILGPKFARA